MTSFTARAPSAAPATARTARRVLVVEDDAFVRHAVSRMFAKAGWTVADVEGADGAFAAAASDPPDLVVTDVMLIGMNGAQIAAELRRERPTLPVVFISGHSAEYLASRVGPLEHFLEKPFTREALLKLADETVAQRRTEDQVPSAPGYINSARPDWNE